MKSFFENLFGKKQEPPKIEKCPEPVRRNAPEREEFELYKKGDVIGGKYDVLGKLGKGGFGIVYLVRLRETGEVFALKTFRDELLGDIAAQQAFKKEALLWCNLESHPFILTARWVQEIHGRLFVMMDYVAADAQGRVSLADHLAGRRLDTNQVLKWAVQFCLGMEHATARGIECHRDIKPANILISQDGTLKISDFGLAAAAEVAWSGSSGSPGASITGAGNDEPGFSLMRSEGKAMCGTPGYMPPEVCRGEGADIRSDIYSFGVVLWQMSEGSSKLPFTVMWRGNLQTYVRDIYEQQMARRVPRVEGVLSPIIERCLRPLPSERFASFRELRGILETLLERRTGGKIESPENEAQTPEFWSNKGGALSALGRHEEAIACFDKALAVNPRYAHCWNNKGAVLFAIRRYEESLSCFDKSLTIDANQVNAWSNMGNVLETLGRHEEAIRCQDKALNLEPRDSTTWNNKGNALHALRRYEEAVACYDKALAIDQRDARAWYNKAGTLRDLGRPSEAIGCCDKALQINPHHGGALFNKATLQDSMGNWREAAVTYRKFIELSPPQYGQQVQHARQRLHELESKRI